MPYLINKTKDFFINGQNSLAAIVPCGFKGGPECNLCYLFTLISNIINFLTRDIMMPLAVVIFIYGGFLLMTAGGDPGKVEKGKKAFTSAVWGMVIVVAAWIIVDTMLKAVVAPGFFSFGPWNQFPACPAKP